LIPLFTLKELNKKTIMELYQAAQIIQSIFKQKVVLIEFEDGSGVKFNYRLKGQSGRSFINLKNIIYKDNSVSNIVSKM